MEGGSMARLWHGQAWRKPGISALLRPLGSYGRTL
jgi:hypothetical protein